MRIQLFLIGWCIVAAGCNADPRCRRETALLRAEILDLEDKYYVTRAQRDDALAVLDSNGRSAESQQIARAMPESGEVSYGDVIYEGDGIVYGEGAYYESQGIPTLSAYPSGEVFYEDSPADLLVEGQVADPYSITPLNEPTQAEAGAGDLIESDRAMDLQISPPNNPSSNSSRDSVVPSEPDGVPTPATQEFPEVDGDTPDPLSLLLSDPSEGVAQIVINSAQTRGQDTDDHPGDDELDVLLQLKTAAGKTVLQPGRLTVSVIDPTVASSSQRVGMWKFVPEESKLFFANGDTDLQGIQLHLPWGQTRPQGDHVVVFVRFLSRDGRRFETSAKVPVHSPSTLAVEGDRIEEKVAGWSGRRDRSSASTNRASGVGSQGESGKKATPAISASHSMPRVSKPDWRPVR